MCSCSSSCVLGALSSVCLKTTLRFTSRRNKMYLKGEGEERGGIYCIQFPVGENLYSPVWRKRASVRMRSCEVETVERQ